MATGRIFGAWVDLREGADLRRGLHRRDGPVGAVFVPRGVGNAFQTLEDETAYTYLVNDHWRPGHGPYTVAEPRRRDRRHRLADPAGRGRAVARRTGTTPRLADVTADGAAPKTLVLGAGGQLGRALRGALPGRRRGRPAPSSTCADAGRGRGFGRGTTTTSSINAAAYTAVDAAETPEGRGEPGRPTSPAPRPWPRLAREHRLTLVHVSTDYVFDGTARGRTPRTSRSPRWASTARPRRPATSPAALVCP